MTVIRGYCDRPSAEAGETLSFQVSCDPPGQFEAQLVRLRHLDPDPRGPGVKIDPVASAVEERYEGRRQRTQVGSYVEVPSDPVFAGQDGFSVQALVHLATVDPRRQSVVSVWADDEAVGWMLMIEDGRPCLRIGDGAEEAYVVSDRALFAGIWYAIGATFDRSEGRLTLVQRPIVTSANGRFGPVVPLDSATVVSERTSIVPAGPTVPLLIAACAESASSDRTWACACLDGKIASPRFYAATLSVEELQLLNSGGEVERVRPQRAGCSRDPARRAHQRTPKPLTRRATDTRAGV